MPIREFTDDSIEQECSKCGAVRQVPFEDIAVGVKRDDHFDGAIIPVSRCPDCGATEYLIRSPEDEPAHPSPGSFGHLHRLLTDKLHARLVKSEHLADGLSPKNLPATKEPSDNELSKWFKDGLRLRRPAEKDRDDEKPIAENTEENPVE